MISTLLQPFITRMQMFKGDIEYLKNTYNDFIKRIKAKYEKWYYIDFGDDHGICEWTEWAYVVTCPNCGSSIILSENNKLKNGVYRCSNVDCECFSNGVKRIECLPNGSAPLRVKYKSSKTGVIHEREINSVTQICDFDELCNIVAKLKNKPNFEIPMNWDRQHEDRLFERGVIEYKDIFTKRNYAINCCIFNDILSLKNVLPLDIYEMLYFLFSSSLRYTNNMTRVTENWEGGKPTSMDKHAYWLPNQYVETNIIDVISKRAKAVITGVKYSKATLPEQFIEVYSFEELKNKNGYLVLNRSSASLPIPDKSVDVVITDPPYGSNVQYAELSAVWNAWYEVFSKLDSFIYRDEEAVVNRKVKIPGAKTEIDYEELLFNIFLECNRVLKESGYMVFTFNNKNIKVWIAMLRAVAKAGFYLPEDGVLFQDYIQSYKNTAHLKYAGNIHGDFIYSFIKGDNPASSILDGFSLQKVIEVSIDDQIEKLYKQREGYTTTELYQKIFAKLTCVLMAYITAHLNDESELLQVESYSNDYFNNQLKKKLTYTNEIWVKRK